MVRTTGIEIAGPEFSKNVLQVPLSENDHVIETLLPGAPPQHGLGLDQQQSVTPARYQAREEHNQASLVRLQCRPFHLARCHDELLAKQSVLGDEFTASAPEVTDQPFDQRQRPRSRRSATLNLAAVRAASLRSRRQAVANTIATLSESAGRTSLVLDEELRDPAADANGSKFRGPLA
jgi:hypothetical protein